MSAFGRFGLAASLYGVIGLLLYMAWPALPLDEWLKHQSARVWAPTLVVVGTIAVAGCFAHLAERQPGPSDESSESIATPGRWLYGAGMLLSLAYLAFLAWYFSDRWNDIKDLPPNNLGDFLAGAFSPLAFAWLVLGFLQQGIELRQNSAALALQAKELRTAAEHAGAMVELQTKEFGLRIQELEDARQKAEAASAAAAERKERAAAAAAEREEREAILRVQPNFHFELAFRDLANPNKVNGNLTNRGHACANVRIRMEPIPGVLELIDGGEIADFQSQLRTNLVFASFDRIPRTHRLAIEFTDAHGTARVQAFIVSVKDNHLSFSAAET